MRSRKVWMLALFSTVFALLVLGGCSGRGSFSSDISDENGAYTVIADDAAKDSAVGMLGGGFEVGAGQYVVVSPDLEKGSVQVTLLDAEGAIALEENVSGKVLSTYVIEPGEYSIGASCNENGTTGKVVIVAVDADEFEKQNQDLEAALAASGVNAD